MNEKPQRKLRWRLLRWGLIGLVMLVTLAALFVTEENWRGKRAWENYKRDAEARGEKLDIASVVPPAVPDDQNFFCAPIMLEAFDCLKHNNDENHEPENFRLNFKIYRGDSKLWPEHGGNFQKGTLTDLKEWQDYLKNFGATPEGTTNGFPVSAQPQSPAADVLTALSIYNPALEELRQAAQRPAARLPLDYEKGFGVIGELMLWLAEMKRCAQFLNLRIIAELQAGQNEAAFADVKLLLRLGDSLRNQPLLITHLVHVAMTAISLQAVYEGLVQHRWTDAQLAELEQVLAKQDFLADGLTALQGEKIFALNEFEQQRLTRKMQMEVNEQGHMTTNIVSLSWMPAAYFYQNQLCFAQMHDRYATQLLDATNRIISPSALKRVEAEIKVQARHYSPYTVQAVMTLPALTAAVSKFSRIQSQVDMTRVACALERFRLAHGNYPETLEMLAPQFIGKIPRDIMNGQPLHYRREGEKFVIWSVGWDEKDDGGSIVLDKEGRVGRDKGDWVLKN